MKLCILILFLFSYLSFSPRVMGKDGTLRRINSGNAFLHNYLLKQKIINYPSMYFSQIEVNRRLVDEFTVSGRKIYLTNSSSRECWHEDFLDQGMYISIKNDTVDVNFYSLGRYYFNSTCLIVDFSEDTRNGETNLKTFSIEWECLTNLQDGSYSILDTLLQNSKCSSVYSRINDSNSEGYVNRNFFIPSFYRNLDKSLLDELYLDGDYYVLYDSKYMLNGYVERYNPLILQNLADGCLSVFFINDSTESFFRSDFYKKISIFSKDFSWRGDLYMVDDGYYVYYSRGNTGVIVKYLNSGGYEIIDIVPIAYWK